MKRILLLLLPAIALVSGCQNKNSFTVSGIIKGETKRSIYMHRVNVNTLVFIDSSEISRKGSFKFKVKTIGPDFYQVGFSSSDFITILAEPGEKIKLGLNGKNLYKDYTVTGSEGSEQVRMLDKQLTETKIKLDSLKRVYEIASKEPGFDEKGPMLETEYSNLLKDIRKKNIEFIITHTGSMASLKALYQRIDENTYVLYDPKDLQYLKIISDSLGKYYPGSRNVQALAEDLKNEMNQMFTRRFQSMADTLPEIRLDPDLKDINGRRIALSSLKGKVVLLTFWTAQSKECIAENLQLKDLYKIYNKKGFEIYQISLDENEEFWKNEVRFDELPWISTREDDPRNPENAKLYNITTLPSNYLYSREGVIIGRDLHGRTLQIKLNQLFNN